MVKVSVLIPVYNASSFLRESISSILNQTFTDFELILLNDASTDNSREIIKEFKDPRIRYYENKQNLGISGSRNRLMELAEGEYLAVMDNDDVSLPERLDRQVNYLNEHPEVSVVGSWGKLFNHRSAATFVGKVRKFVPNMGWVWCQPEIVTAEETLRGNTCMHSSMMISRRDFEACGIRYNPLYTPAEDYDLIRQALCCGLKVRNIQDILFKYHLHGNNFSLQKKQMMKEADVRVKKDICKFLKIEKYRPYPYWLVILRKLRLEMFL